MIQDSKVRVVKLSKQGALAVKKNPVIRIDSIRYGVQVSGVELLCSVSGGRLAISGQMGNKFVFNHSKPEVVEAVALALLECARLGKKRKR